MAAISTHFATRTYPPVDASDAQSCRPDFAIAVCPGHLWAHADEDGATRDPTKLSLRPDITVTAQTPPTFLLQAQDDHVDGVSQVLAYYVALNHANVPVEMHVYAQGGMASVCALRGCRSRSGRSWGRPGCTRSAYWIDGSALLMGTTSRSSRALRLSQCGGAAGSVDAVGSWQLPVPATACARCPQNRHCAPGRLAPDGRRLQERNA